MGVALFLGLLDKDRRWLLAHGIAVLILVLLAFYWLSDRRKNRLSRQQRRRVRRERLIAPITAVVAGREVLPWQPGPTAVASMAIVFGTCVALYFGLSHAAEELARPLTARSTTTWALRTRRRGFTIKALAFVAAAASTTAGAVAVGALTASIGPEASSEPASGPCPHIDPARFAVPPSVALQMDAALRTEGRDAGCAASRVALLRSGAYVVATDRGYVVLGWEKMPLPSGIDKTPLAAVWWRAAFDVADASDVFDSLPGDRLNCPNGAVAPLVDHHGVVTAVVASADYQTWHLVSHSLVSEYLRLASRRGRLPMPVRAAEGKPGEQRQLMDSGTELAESRSTVVRDWRWLQRMCG